MVEEPRTLPSDLSETMVLVKRYQRGDEAALNELFDRYYPRVYRIVRLRMSQRLRRALDPEDLVQETFIKAVKNFDRFEMKEPASLVQWISKIAEGQIRDAAKKAFAQKRDLRRAVELAATRGSRFQTRLSAQLAGGTTGIPSKLARVELCGIVDECIDELTDDYREVILLRDISEGSWEFIRAELGRPTVAAAQQLHRRAKIRLAELLRRRIRE